VYLRIAAFEASSAVADDWVDLSASTTRGTNMLTTEAFEKWLVSYGEAWEARDPAAATRIFSSDALYHWTPIDPPKVGHTEIAGAWAYATGSQKDIEFRYTIWVVRDTLGAAHWHARYTGIETGLPVEIDGVLLAEFDGSGLCRVFREWWHSTEAVK
jgi:hypothetical protein